jgi:hypothetical protein
MWEQRQRELSFLRCFRQLHIFAFSLLNCLRNKDALVSQLINFSDEVISLCAMNKRKSRHSTARQMRLLAEGGT